MITKQSLKMMIIDMSENQAEYLFALANKLFFNGEWKADEDEPVKREYITRIEQMCNATDDLSLLDLIFQILAKSARMEAKK